MEDIAVVVSVAGEEAYFEFASVSIPSFLRNNKSVDLFIFTDDVEKIAKLRGPLTDRLHIVDLEHCFKKEHYMVKRLEMLGVRDSEMAGHTERYGYLHHHIFISALLPVVECFLQNKEKYTHILKIDIDSYFAGGDMMTLVKEDVQKAGDYDLFLVERKHRLMQHYGGGFPGVGFTLWKKGSNFIPMYISRFHKTEQVTILELYRKNRVKTKVLTRPGYHFVRPFLRAQKTGKKFTKEQALEFLPAYFHFHGKDAYQNIKRMEKWFNNA